MRWRTLAQWAMMRWRKMADIAPAAYPSILGRFAPKIRHTSMKNQEKFICLMFFNGAILHLIIKLDHFLRVRLLHSKLRVFIAILMTGVSPQVGPGARAPSLFGGLITYCPTTF